MKQAVTTVAFILLFSCMALSGMCQAQEQMGANASMQEEPLFGEGLLNLLTMHLAIGGMTSQGDVDALHQMLAENHKPYVRQVRSSPTTGETIIEFVGTSQVKAAIIASIQNLGYQVQEL